MAIYLVLLVRLASPNPPRFAPFVYLVCTWTGIESDDGVGAREAVE